jgi:hypothetical protein
MRPEEEFVGRALVEYLGGPLRASVSEGDDPPDLYLHFGGARICVEVTRFIQPALGPDGTPLGSRATQDSFGLRLIEELNANVGPKLPDDIRLNLIVWVPVPNASRFKTALTEWALEIAASPERGYREERKFEGSKAHISVIERLPGRRRIAGIVDSMNTSADMDMNARLILTERIRQKDTLCQALPKPVWLAAINDYFPSDADTFAVAASKLKLSHCFERVLLVADHDGSVTELILSGK